MARKTNPDISVNQPRIFLSYARKDGEAFVRDLRKKLTEPKALSQPKFSLWQDRTQMEGGKDWWDQILEALKQVEYMVLVMTQASLESPIVRKEWRQARQEGVGVIPVFGQSNLDLTQLPRWMRDVHWVNTEVPEQWARFIRTLESPHQGTQVPFMPDDLPAGYVPRHKEFEELAGRLLDPEQEEPIAITAALKGAGGYGKTTLAKALCHDERIQDAFHDGILWVTLGEQPNTMAGLTKLYAALTEERPNFADEEDASTKLAEILGDKDCLMVIDDVWNAAHLRPFLRGGKRCGRIITTRDSTTLPETAKLRVPIDAMRQQEALALLAFDLLVDDLREAETVSLRALAARLGEWPFLLKLANATLRERVNTMGQPLPAALAYVQKALDKRGLTAFDARIPVERDQAVAITLGASFEHLKEDELARYQELAIFPEDVEIPLTAVTKIWGATGGLDDFDTEELCTRLNQLSLLLKYDPTTQRIQLHDVVRTYLEEQITSNLPALHRQLLETYDLQDQIGDAARDSYLCHHLGYHFVKAERWSDLKQILLAKTKYDGTFHHCLHSNLLAQVASCQRWDILRECFFEPQLSQVLFPIAYPGGLYSCTEPGKNLTNLFRFLPWPQAEVLVNFYSDYVRLLKVRQAEIQVTSAEEMSVRLGRLKNRLDGPYKDQSSEFGLLRDQLYSFVIQCGQLTAIEAECIGHGISLSLLRKHLTQPLKAIEQALLELTRCVKNISGMFDDYASDAAYNWTRVEDLNC